MTHPASNVVNYLKGVMRETPKVRQPVIPLDHVHNMVEEIRVQTRRDLARTVLSKLYEDGVIHPSEV